MVTTLQYSKYLFVWQLTVSVWYKAVFLWSHDHDPPQDFASRTLCRASTRKDKNTKHMTQHRSDPSKSAPNRACPHTKIHNAVVAVIHIQKFYTTTE